jgi:hypothetical protein
MRKADIDSILLVNWYFTTRKLTSPLCPKTEMIRKYLLKKVNKTLINRETSKCTPLLSKVFVFLTLFIVSNF